MGGGVLSGLGLGLVISAVVLAALSLSTPLPDRPAAAPEAAHEASVPVEAPAEAEQGVNEPAPEAPAEESAAPEPATPTAPVEDAAPEPTLAPTPDADDPAPTAPEDEAAAPVEDTAQAAALDIDSASPDTPGPEEATEEPRIALPQIDATPQTTGPSAPAGDSAAQQAAPTAETVPAPTPEIAAAPEQPAPASVPVAPSPRFIAGAETGTTGTTPRRLALPQVAEAPATADTSTAPAPDPQPDPAADPVAAEEAPVTPRRVIIPQAPEAETDVASPAAESPDTPDETAAAPEAGGEAPGARRITLPQVTDTADAAAPAPDTGRTLPQVGAEPAADPAAPAETPADTAPPGPPNALRDNAVDFDAPAGRPLMAIVLIDDPDSPLDSDLLTQFTFPVSFAIDPLRADAAARAAELRDAGFEVVILGGGLIPEGAAPSDVEIALASARETVPQAVAVMDTPDSRIQADRGVLDATVTALGGSGHGLLAFPRGLNAAEQSARRADVPAATFFRMLDDEGQRATVITRYLGRVAFAAGQEGAVAVAGSTQPDTVTALFSWALGSRTEQVTLAPVSAVLQRLSE